MIIRIKNSSWFITYDDLREFCFPFVKVFFSAVKFNSESQQSNGYGFVEMSVLNCQQAIKILDGLSYYPCYLKGGIACNL